MDEFAAAFARLEDVMRHHDPAVCRILLDAHDRRPRESIVQHDHLAQWEARRGSIHALWRGLTA